jgi:hypothetical protein
MTTFHPELFHGLRSYPGQAHPAGGGPLAACCGQCQHWGGDPKKSVESVGRCGKHCELGGDAGPPVPAYASACKYFAAALPEPPARGARFMAIAMSALPAGWSYSFRRGLSGCCRMQLKLIEAPKPGTRKALYIWLHECAHAVRHHNNRKPPEVEEYEAEQWAHAKMRAHGVPVPRAMTQRAKRHVAHEIRTAKLAGAKRIDAKARRFSK